MVARLYGRSRAEARRRADEVLGQLGLDEIGDRLVRTYSGGSGAGSTSAPASSAGPGCCSSTSRRRASTPAAATSCGTPSAGSWRRGTDVLLTTQYLDEADQLAGRIVIVDHGRVIADGSPAELKSRAGRDVVEVHPRDAADLPAVARALALPAPAPGEPVVDAATRRVVLAVDPGTEPIVAAARALDEAGLVVDDLACAARPSTRCSSPSRAGPPPIDTTPPTDPTAPAAA